MKITPRPSPQFKDSKLAREGGMVRRLHQRCRLVEFHSGLQDPSRCSSCQCSAGRFGVKGTGRWGDIPTHDAREETHRDVRALSLRLDRNLASQRMPPLGCEVANADSGVADAEGSLWVPPPVTHRIIRLLGKLRQRCRLVEYHSGLQDPTSSSRQYPGLLWHERNSQYNSDGENITVESTSAGPRGWGYADARCDRRNAQRRCSISSTMGWIGTSDLNRCHRLAASADSGVISLKPRFRCSWGKWKGAPAGPGHLQVAISSSKTRQQTLGKRTLLLHASVASCPRPAKSRRRFFRAPVPSAYPAVSAGYRYAK
ncbi:hypothetical protein DFH06DRAFT_1205057 [Mycena polygramma]|nr:hypothetical protein DFH06DRAFT_1205057 [Mycena polygramma]